MQARVFNIQRYSIYDGPGIRTLVFFQGCPLRCLWCSNPEGKSPRTRIMWIASLCSYCGLCTRACPEGVHTLEGTSPSHKMSPEKCRACGACVAVCPNRALTLCGKSMSIAEIMETVLKDIVFYQTSGGGLTIGGGEPLAQIDAACELLAAARAEGIHTAVETCGHVPWESISRASEFVDLFLFDIKHLDSAKHKELTGQGNELILGNLTWLLDKGHKVKVRMPLINGCNADFAEISRRVDFLEPWSNHLQGVDLLPYHKLGTHKYAQLGEAYSLGPDASVSQDFLEAAQALFQKANIPTAVVRH